MDKPATHMDSRFPAHFCLTKVPWQTSERFLSKEILRYLIHQRKLSNQQLVEIKTILVNIYHIYIHIYIYLSLQLRCTNQIPQQ